jgi:large conductance mechanosensitive channel
MLKVFREFRTFSMGGHMIDLALGFIIGAAFSKLAEAFAQNVVMDLVAALFGQPDFTSLNIRIHRSQIHVGVFLSELVSFLLLAWVLFLLVKMISAFGIGRRRVFEERECPYCLELVSPRALICKTCGQALVDELPPLAEAEKRAAELRTRRSLSLPPIPVPARRREPAATAPTAPDND